MKRLWSIRRLVFGAGSLQVGLSALTIGGIAWAWDHTLDLRWCWAWCWRSPPPQW